MKWFRWQRTQSGQRATGQGRQRSRRADAVRRQGRRKPGIGWSLACAGLCVWVACSFAVSFRRMPPPVHLVAGEIADRNLYSEVPFRYADAMQTERLRSRASQEVPPVYQLSLPAAESALQGLAGLGDMVRGRSAVPERPAVAPTVAEGGTAADPLEGLDAPALDALRQVVADPARYRILQDLARDALHAGILEEREITALREPESPTVQVTFLNDRGGAARTSLLPVADLRDPKRGAAGVAAEFAARFPDTGDVLRRALEQTLARLLRPSMVQNAEATIRARRQAVAAVETVMRFVGANEVLVLRGEVVNQDMIDRLEKHQQELHLRQTAQTGVLGTLQGPLVCAVLILCAGYMLAVLQPELLADRRLVTLMALALVLQVLLNRTVTGLHFLNSGSSFYLFPLLPLAFAAMVLAPLAGLRAAVVGALLTVAVAAWQIRSPEAFHLCITGTASSLVGAALMQRARRRAHLIRTGAAVFATVLLLELLFSIRGTLPAGALGRALLPLVYYAMANAFGVTALVFMLLPLLEYAFGVASDLSLVELSDLNHPLMKRLQLEAPGTYHHSLTVATLAEQAAEAIGANPLMARVCAYFHDIGKLDQPEYFAENALHGVNPHDDLQPRMSSLVILNHVRHGIELARRYKLKRPLRETIAQHHGTSLVYYFYRKARDLTDPGQAVGESEFRYPGPRPRRKEIVLVSLADSCEAASRSLDRPTAAKVGAMVDAIFNDRLRDHGLDDADLTVSELARSRDVMVRTLATMMHARVPYPKEGAHEGDSVEAGPPAAVEGPPAVLARPA
jgi:putative nucleotidyltransferase with HDIG domain